MVDPFIISDGIFPNSFKTSGTLYVPAGTRHSYIERGWGNYFINIVEKEESEPIWLSIVVASHGTTKLKCEAGKSYTFQLKASGNWKIHSVTYEGIDVPHLLTNDGEFTTPIISESKELNVAYEEVTTGVKSEIPHSIHVNSYHGTLTISGASAGTPISIYDLNGGLIASSTAVDGITRVDCSGSEKVVIVKVGERSVKVAR